MKIAIYAGSFDPITNGHLDIIKSGAEIFDKVIVAIAYNTNKSGFLPVEARKNLIKISVEDIPNVEVDSFEGLTVDYARQKGAKILLRGVRASADFEYETQLAQTNNVLNQEIKTVVLVSKPEYSYISSSAVREILINKGDISKLVPQPVNDFFKRDTLI